MVMSFLFPGLDHEHVYRVGIGETFERDAERYSAAETEPTSSRTKGQDTSHRGHFSLADPIEHRTLSFDID
jgi:hypothetical protein